MTYSFKDQIEYLIQNICGWTFKILPSVITSKLTIANLEIVNIAASFLALKL